MFRSPYGNLRQRADAVLEGSKALLQAFVQDQAEGVREQFGQLVRDAHDQAAAQANSRLREETESRYHELLQRLQQEAAEAGAKAAAESKAASEQILAEMGHKATSFASVLREEAAQASSRIESSLNSSLENYRQQLAQITQAGLEGHRQAITDAVAGLHSRLKQAVQPLDPGEVQG